MTNCLKVKSDRMSQIFYGIRLGVGLSKQSRIHIFFGVGSDYFLRTRIRSRLEYWIAFSRRQEQRTFDAIAF